MRLGFQRLPSDIFAVFASFLILLMLVYLSVLDYGLTVLVAGVLAGYMTVAACFPNSQHINWGERCGLSIGIGIVEAATISLTVQSEKAPVGSQTALIGIGILVLIVGGAALIMRLRLPAT